uniref:Cationic amino acid transporter 3 n=1 Tax=Cacopsylla melanoneura TaxID=428564 RepID=A0A8D8YCI2_9HEMI
MSWWHNFLEALSRRKYYSFDDEDDVSLARSESNVNNNGNHSNQGHLHGNEKTPHSAASAPGGEPQKLARVLGLVDLTMLGVGATLGVGVYVLAGSVARNQAGPSVVISFAIAAVASLFSGFCYSEFASRISKAGSAYNYTYLSIGEFAAYVIGWNMVLEYIIGTASEAKAISNQIDSLMGNAYQRWMTGILPIHSSFLSSYPDFIAPVFVFLITALLSWGARESTKVNNALTFINLGTVGVIVFTGMFKLNPANWSIRKGDIPPGVKNAGTGGFAPFGIAGIMTGAAKCFFGFVGFDGISTTGEETRNPKRNIPLAIILSLMIVFVCYFSIAVVITMIIPYYEQDPDAPFPAIFERLGWPTMKWLVTTGSLVALFTAMFGAFFPLPRILYSMSRDGLLYKIFAYVSPRTKTPIISTAISGVITAIMSAIFKLDQLVDMMSIGTLLAYIIVGVCVLLLRYSNDGQDAEQGGHTPGAFVETLGNSYKEDVTDDSDETSQSNVNNENAGVINDNFIPEDGASQLSSPSKVSLPLSIQEYIRASTRISNSPQVSELTEFQSSPNGDGFSKTVNNDEDFVSITKRETVKRHADVAEVSTAAYCVREISDASNGLAAEKTLRNANVFETNKKALGKLKRIFHQLFNTEGISTVNGSSEHISKVCIYILILLTIVGCFMLNSITSVVAVGEESVANRGPYMSRLNESTILPSLTFIDARNSSLNKSESFTNIPTTFSQGNTNLHKEYSVLSHQTEGVEAGGPSFKTLPIVEPTLGSYVHQQLVRVESSNAILYLKEISHFDSDTRDRLRYCWYASVGILYTLTFTILSRQGQNTRRLNFKVPFVPLVPCVSIFMNIYLMINLDISTWVRFIVWLAVGLVVYFTYGIFHSKQKTN